MEILYADADLIVINKPPGILVHPVRSQPPLAAAVPLKAGRTSNGADGGVSVSGATVADFLLAKFPEIKGVGEDPLRPGIVHRLDSDTSGVMVAARTQKSFAALKELFSQRRVEKVYWAIVCGRPRMREGIIDSPIGRLVTNPTKRGVAVGKVLVRRARDAITGYKVLRPGEKFSLVELTPKTGRMHQIRVHLKVIGHPVACDIKYGGKNVCCPIASGLPRRQLLHAKSLSFSFPEGRRLYFEADLPSDMEVAEKMIF